MLLSTPRLSHTLPQQEPKKGEYKVLPCEGTATHGTAAQMASSLGKASAHIHRLSSPSSRSSLGVSFSSLIAKDPPAGVQLIDAQC